MAQSRRQSNSCEVLQEEKIYNEPPIKMAKMKNSENIYCWWRCGETRSLIPFGWECKMVQPLWKTVWQFLSKLKMDLWTSLVGQWIRICLPVQGTWVWSLLQEWEDFTCRGATKSTNSTMESVCHNCWSPSACGLHTATTAPACCNQSRHLEPAVCNERTRWEAHAPQDE